MLELIIFIIYSLSATNIIQKELIFSRIREYLYKNHIKIYDFLVCPTCFGFHIGWMLSFFFILNANIVLNFFICALISSYLNKILRQLVNENFGKI